MCRKSPKRAGDDLEGVEGVELVENKLGMIGKYPGGAESGGELRRAVMSWQ